MKYASHIVAALAACWIGTSTFAADQVASSQPARVTWSARDTRGEEVRVPSGAKSVCVVLFAMAGQTRSQEAVQQLGQALKGTDVHPVVVVSGENAGAASHQFETADKWPLVADPTFAACGTFGVHVWPTTVIVAADGTIDGHLAGLPNSYLVDVEAFLAFAGGKIDRAQLQQRLAGQNVISDDPEQMAARHLRVAERLLDKDLKQDAQKELNAAIALRPQLVETRVGIARLLLAAGRTAEAVSIIDSLPPDSISPSQLNFLRGKALVLQGKWEKAADTLVEAIKLNPEPAEAWYQLGQVYDQLKDPAKAAVAYRKAFESTELGKKLRQE